MISPWWEPLRHTDRRERLRARNRIKTALRDWFMSEDFTEVECGALVVSPGNQLPDLRIAADGKDGFAPSSHGLGPRHGRVRGPHARVDQREGCLLRGDGLNYEH